MRLLSDIDRSFITNLKMLRKFVNFLKNNLSTVAILNNFLFDSIQVQFNLIQFNILFSSLISFLHLL